MTQPVPFAKMNGNGNEIIVADMRGRSDHVTPEAAVALASHARTHYDQLMAIHDGVADQGADVSGSGVHQTIEIFNADGSRSGACGNGTRCVVDYLRHHGQAEVAKFYFDVDGQALKSWINDDGLISVDMGLPRFDWNQIPLSEEFADTRGIELEVGPVGDPVLHTPSVANVGNPHVIFWASEDVWSYGLEKFGPMIEFHPLFPEQVNVSVAQVTGPNALTMRTFERGVGITQACGSAACAAAVSACRLGLTGRDVTVTQPGGDLHISWQDNGAIWMTGPAEFEFAGTFDPITGEWTENAEVHA